MEVLVVVIGLPVGTFLLTRWRLHRRNRVHPRVASPAPLTWLVSPAAPARLHRRLQTTVRVASIHAPRKPLSDVALQAIELDRRVVLASKQPYGARGSVLRELVREADELDRLALAVNRPFDSIAVGDPADRLTAMAEARREVDELDRSYRI
ncbi:MAG TPA: hypothetical protein VD926_00765 [Acidimicrobiales bacterium]|nr:hypothetical protein [Acidimicrobiales bacterium]